MPAPSLPGIYKRLERAQSNFKRLYDEYVEHFQSEQSSCVLRAEIDGEYGVVKAVVAPLPDWQLLISDIVCDMRFLLDNLAYELVIANTGKIPKHVDHIEFPIFTKRERFMKINGNGPASGSGLAKIKGMADPVQRLIKHLQPYHELENGTHAKDHGLLLLDKVCNVYKHQLLVPICLLVERIDIDLKAVGCSLSEARACEVEGELKDGAIVATFRVERYSEGSEVYIGATPVTFISFPPGLDGASYNVIDFGRDGLNIVRAIVAGLTELQWGTPMDLPDTPPYFVTPLAVTIPQLYV